MNIEKSGGVAEGHDAGFLLYSGERPQGARRNIIENDCALIPKHLIR